MVRTEKLNENLNLKHSHNKQTSVKNSSLSQFHGATCFHNCCVGCDNYHNFWTTNPNISRTHKKNKKTFVHM